MTLSQHTLRSYDKQLDQLLSLILEMGGAVHDMLDAARTSFRVRSEDSVSDAKRADKRINALDIQIEDEATVVLALQNPMAIDLRFVTSVLKITGMLERAADLAKNIIKRGVRMGDYTNEEATAKLELMASIIINMLDDTLVAFREKDTQKAAQVWRKDDEIDTLYRDIITLMQAEMTNSSQHVMPCTHVVFMAKNLERIADYVTNFAKSVYYVTSGKRPDKATLRSLSEL
jgi:phosphate transport system protein